MLTREENDSLDTRLKWFTRAFYDRLLLLGLTVEEKESLFDSYYSAQYDRQIIDDLKQDQKNHQIPRHLNVAKLRNEFVRLLQDFIEHSTDKAVEVFLDHYALHAARQHKLVPLFRGMLHFSDRAHDFLTEQRLSPSAIERSAKEWKKIRFDIHKYHHIHHIHRERNFLICLALIFAIYFVIQLLSKRENLLISGALTLLTFAGSDWNFSPAMLKPDLQMPNDNLAKQLEKFIQGQRYVEPENQRTGLSVNPNPRPATAFFPEVETKSKRVDRTDIPKSDADAKKQAPEARPDLDDGAGSIYLRMNRRGWYFRFNRDEIAARPLVQQYDKQDHVMSKIEDALIHRDIHKANSKEWGVTEVSRKEKIPLPYKVRTRHDHRLWVNARPAERAFELAHPEIETVLTPRGEGLHKKKKRR